MSKDPLNTSKRALEPIGRVSEVLFGLIMVLTFTGSLSVAFGTIELLKGNPASR